MAGTTNRNFPIYSLDDPTNGPAQMQALAQAIDAEFGPETDYITCTGMNPNITGTAKIKLDGKTLHAELSLTYTTGSPNFAGANWPNTQVTGFTLPDVMYAPRALHRMSMAGPFQPSAGTVTLVGNPGSTAVYVGANGTTAGAIYWSGALWDVA